MLNAILRHIRREAYCSTERLDRSVHDTNLSSQNSEAQPGVGLRGRKLECLPIQGFGFVLPIELMQLLRLVQQCFARYRPSSLFTQRVPSGSALPRGLYSRSAKA